MCAITWGWRRTTTRRRRRRRRRKRRREKWLEQMDRTSSNVHLRHGWLTSFWFFLAYALCSDKSSNFSLPQPTTVPFPSPRAHPPFHSRRAGIKKFRGRWGEQCKGWGQHFKFHPPLPTSDARGSRQCAAFPFTCCVRSPKNNETRKIQWILNVPANMHLGEN